MTPSYLTHYFVRGMEPFRTISELDESQWEVLCNQLSQLRETDSTYNRRFSQRYRAIRLDAEHELRSRFQAAGGKIERRSPIYFCLGSSTWWEGFCDHEQIRIGLDQIDPTTVSFTYPDSLTSLGFLRQFGLLHDEKPYHGKVFRLDQIDEVIRKYGFPDGRSDSEYREYHKEDLETYIEAQLWSDAPIEAFKQHTENKPQHPTT